MLSKTSTIVESWRGRSMTRPATPSASVEDDTASMNGLGTSKSDDEKSGSVNNCASLNN